MTKNRRVLGERACDINIFRPDRNKPTIYLVATSGKSKVTALTQDETSPIGSRLIEPDQRTGNARHDRSALYTVAFERSQTPMMIADAGVGENTVLFANDAFLELTGYSLEEIVGRDCRFLQGPGTSQETIQEIRAAIKAEAEVDVTILNYRKDGSEFWNKLYISPVRDSEGKINHYFASQSDVTELRRITTLEETERRLLKEVDHRALNLIAVVNGIVRLSASEDPDRYADAVRQRVQALADVHVILAESGWNAIALGDLFRQRFTTLRQSAVSLDGPHVDVAATDAQPIALIIHELATNATTHGSLATQTGTLEVEWHPFEIGGFEFSWREKGGEPPLVDRKPGFGTVMLDTLIERQLRGRIQRNWAREGLEVLIRLPHRAASA